MHASDTKNKMPGDRLFSAKKSWLWKYCIYVNVLAVRPTNRQSPINYVAVLIENREERLIKGLFPVGKRRAFNVVLNMLDTIVREKY